MCVCKFRHCWLERTILTIFSGVWTAVGSEARSIGVIAIKVFLRRWYFPKYSPFPEDLKVTPLYHLSLNSIYVQNHCRNWGYTGWRKDLKRLYGPFESRQNELCEPEVCLRRRQQHNMCRDRWKQNSDYLSVDCHQNGRTSGRCVLESVLLRR